SEIESSLPDLSSGAIKRVRKGFKIYNKALAKYAKQFAPEKVKKTGVKIFYCPMVKGEWFQKASKPRNPYLGKKMPMCGTAVDY
ncbi:MAG: DUF3347 domain-containing protein, partial [Candidatus Dadabacteria bacterium]